MIVMAFFEPSPQDCSWYHGILSAKEAERRLVTNGVPGYFLLRQSELLPGEYILSYLLKGKIVRHVKIPKNRKIIQVQSRSDLLFAQYEPTENLMDIVNYIISNHGNGALYIHKLHFIGELKEEAYSKLFKTDQSFVCTVCNSEFDNHKKLRIHSRNHNLRFSDKYKSLIFQKNVSNQIELDTFNHSVKWFCEQCDFRTKRKLHLEKHVKGIHDKVIHSKTSFDCNICDIQFKNKIQLGTHKKIVHAEVPRCSYCDKAFANFGNMKNHEIRIHINPPKKIGHECPECFEICQTSSKLEKHRKSHLFKSQNMKSQTTEKLLTCKLCTYRTKFTYNLNRHEKRHSTDTIVYFPDFVT